MRRSNAVDGNPVITHIWNGSEIVAEVGGANPTIQNTYVYGLERIMTGDGEYFTYNSHGDTTGFDGDEYDYDAFGNQIDTNTQATYNPFRYCGEYFDEETGFVYLRARYYDPSTQRFVTEDPHWNLDNMIYGDRTFGEDETPVPDPAAAVQSGNLYAYCMGNPVRFFDSRGLNYTDSAIQFYYQASESDGPSPVLDLLGAVVVLGAIVVDALAKDQVQSIDESKETTKTADVSKPKKIVVFPYDPNTFCPTGLTKICRTGTKNGKIISWMDPFTNTEVFRWDENINYSNGSHYHINGVEGVHYYSNYFVPEPYSSRYFPG